MRFWIKNFGCQMNVADAEEMACLLAGMGFEPAPDLKSADIAIVNTCTVRQHAEDRAKSEIGRLKTWKERSAGRRLLVTGCAAQRLGVALKRRMPWIDGMVGAMDMEKFGSAVADSLSGRLPAEKKTPVALPDSVSAQITIMRGCNYRCSFCIVPSVRGPEEYIPPERVVRQAQARAASSPSLREVIFLGQTVNSYRSRWADGKQCNFEDLVEAVAGVDGIRRIRFMSPHPHYFSEKSLERLAALPAVCEHFHIPAQSGSDKVLAAMGRNYTKDKFIEKVGQIKAAFPGAAVTTDFIVGFCGETDDDFQKTLDLVEEAGFDDAFTFKYSPRPGTPAAALPDDVPRRVKEERLALLNKACAKWSQRRLRELVGTEQELLLEKKCADVWIGRTRGGKMVELKQADRQYGAGEIVTVKISGCRRKVLMA